MNLVPFWFLGRFWAVTGSIENVVILALKCAFLGQNRLNI